VQDLYMGIIQDKFGRKIPIVFGVLLLGISIGLIPMFSELVPAYLILRICISLGLIIILNLPLLPDYVRPDKMGLANGYMQIVICLARIVAQTILFQISANISNQQVIYYSVGCLLLFVALFSIYGIKDVVLKTESMKKIEKPKLKEILG